MSRFLRFTKIGVSLGLLAAVAYWLDWEKAWNLLRSASPAEFALGLLFLFGAYLANATRLLLLQRRVGLEVPGPLYWGSYYTGLMFNYVLPLGVGDYRLCSQEHQIDWLSINQAGFDVEVVEETHDVAALAPQGPTSCAILKRMGLEGVENLTPLRPGPLRPRRDRTDGVADRLHRRSGLRIVDRPGPCRDAVGPPVRSRA